MMWKICGGVTYNLHNRHRKTALKLRGKKNKQTELRSGFTHFFYLLQIYIHTQSEKGKISSFPPVLDFKLICF